MKKVRIIAVIKVFTIGFNEENGVFSHCTKFNVEISVKILMAITMKIIKLKRMIFTA